MTLGFDDDEGKVVTAKVCLYDDCSGESGQWRKRVAKKAKANKQKAWSPWKVPNSGDIELDGEPLSKFDARICP